jgi:hypothetical protein
MMAAPDLGAAAAHGPRTGELLFKRVIAEECLDDDSLVPQRLGFGDERAGRHNIGRSHDPTSRLAHRLRNHLGVAQTGSERKIIVGHDQRELLKCGGLVLAPGPVGIVGGRRQQRTQSDRAHRVVRVDIGTFIGRHENGQRACA